MNILVCTEWGDNYKEIADYTVPIMREYALRHGYTFHAIQLHGSGNDYAYRKHECFRELFGEIDVDLIWYLDVDAVICNHTIRIETFIDEKHDYFVTRDVTEINCGSVIIKNSAGGRELNDFILHKRRFFPNEQNVVNYYIDVPGYMGNVKVLSHPSINSFDYALYPELTNIREEAQGHFHPGNFLLHTPGAAYNVRLERLKNEKIIR